MEARTRVVVYGSSLHLAGIAASLKAEPGLEVVCVDPRVPGARQTVRALKPAVIAFDVSGPKPDLDVILMCRRRGLLLIGADPNSDELLVLSRHCPQALNTADLVTVIQQRGANREPVKRQNDCALSEDLR